MKYYSKVGSLGSQIGIFGHGFQGVNGKLDGYTFKFFFMGGCSLAIKVVSNDEIKESPEYALLEMTQERFDEWALPFDISEELVLSLIKALKKITYVHHQSYVKV